ncbi:hypothetical protein [Pontibacter liquoris]|uniref:hypothetical protein n=1 Tax=Pontibacter liquoris TaxID=2905677 RepID=UPI001FA7462D|nr:hypothetical protein [Pontibacter liquoris]
MKTYLIGYDLNKSGQNYDALINRIKEISSIWWHNLDSTWIIKSNSSAKDIRDDLKLYIDANDELLVAGLTGEAAWAGFKDKGSTWLLNNILPS